MDPSFKFPFIVTDMPLSLEVAFPLTVSDKLSHPFVYSELNSPFSMKRCFAKHI